MGVGAHEEQDMHSPDLQAVSSHCGGKILNSRILQHFLLGGPPWVPSRETEILVQAVIMSGVGQEASSL